MAEVTRRVIIEVETRQKRSRLDAPDAGSAERAYKAEGDAADRAAEAGERATTAVKKHAETVRSSSLSMVRDFREAGEGAFRMARGIALLSANGSDDLKKLVQTVAVAQGAFDVFAGGFKVYSSLAAVLGGPVTLAVTALTGAIAAGAVEWGRWKGAAQDAAKAAEEATEKALKSLKDFYAEQDRREGRNTDEAARRIGLAITPQHRETLIRQEIARLAQVGQTGLDDINLFQSSNITNTAQRAQAAAGARDLTRAANRQADLQKDLFDIEKERLASERLSQDQFLAISAQAGVGGFGIGAGLGIPNAAASFAIQNDQKFQQLQQEMTSMIDKLLNVAQFGLRKAEQLEAGLPQAK